MISVVWEEPTQATIMAAEFVYSKPYTYLTLTHSKGKEVAKPDREAYLIDISKANQIFDFPMKGKQIKLLEGHKIPPAEEFKGKKYCKWHHSWTHATNNCTVFRNSIQKALKERRLKLAEKGDMIIDTNPFGLSINMVLFFVSQKEKKEGKVSIWKRKLKEKDETRPLQKTIWRAKTMESQETRRQNTSQRVNVF